MDKNRVKVGIAPIGWTNDDLPELGGENTFEQCVSEMALAGFTGCEVGNKYPKNDVPRLKHMLELRGLQICNAWFSTFFVDNRREETVRGFTEHMNFLHEMGAKVIGCSEQSGSIQQLPQPIFEGKRIFSDAEWSRLADGYGEIADLAEAKGMKVCLHHHMGTGIQTLPEIDRFMDVVPKNVYLLYDTGHVYFSEGNNGAVVSVLKKYVSRIVHVHLKDVRAEKLAEVKSKRLSFLEGVKLGAFTVPGDGDIDFAPVFEILNKNDYAGWLVVEAEQDPAIANPLEYALKARAYIRKFGF